MAYKVGMVSLGCAKNQVDGEVLMASLKNAGFETVDDAARSIPIALFGQFISGVVPGAMMLVTPLCIVDGTYMGSLLVVWGGIASAVLLILIFTVSYWVGRRIAKAP